MSDIEKLSFEELAEAISKAKAVEREVSGNRALLEAELIKRIAAEGIDPVKKAYKKSWGFKLKLWELNITPAVKHVPENVAEAKKSLPKAVFDLCFKQVYEFSKSGYNAAVKAAKQKHGEESVEAAETAAVMSTYVDTKYSRPTVSITVTEGEKNEG